MEVRYQDGDDLKPVRVEQRGDKYQVTIGDHTYAVEIDRLSANEVAFRVDGRHRHAYIAEDGQRRYVAFDAHIFTLTHAVRHKRASGADEGNPAATMPGQVVKVLVDQGATVTRGQQLVVIEAMKMEIRVTAPRDGRVARLLCKAGQTVARGQILLELSGM